MGGPPVLFPGRNRSAIRVSEAAPYARCARLKQKFFSNLNRRAWQDKKTGVWGHCKRPLLPNCHRQTVRVS